MITDESVISRDNSSYRLKVTRNVYDKIIISVFCKQRAEFPWRLRPIHTRDFAPAACSRGTLREQSSSGVYQRVHGYTSSSGAEFPLRKMLHDIQPVKYLAESARGKLSELENAPSCVLTRAKWAWTCSGSKTCRVYRPLDVDLSPELSPRGEPCETKVATEVENGEIVYARFLKLKLILMQSYHAD